MSLSLLRTSTARISSASFIPSGLGSYFARRGCARGQRRRNRRALVGAPTRRLVAVRACRHGSRLRRRPRHRNRHGLLSAIIPIALVPDASMSWLAVAIRFAIYFGVALAIASMAAQHRDDLRTLEEHVARRTSELEGVNRTLSAEIAQRAELEQRLEYLVDHDPLTGLYNRHRFEEALGRRGVSRFALPERRRGAADRPRSLQGRQRHARPPGRRSAAQDHRQACSRDACATPTSSPASEATSSACSFGTSTPSAQRSWPTPSSRPHASARWRSASS